VGTVPVLKPREVVALLGKLGFAEVRQHGSHRQFRHADGRGTTVPFHQGRDISPTLLRQIAKDIGLSVDDFVAGNTSTESTEPGKK
jgi:predicted RNA binding protein YcfA (HicA-like mRNA interferase family)